MAFSKYSKSPGDSILALLEPGEYVLNRNAVDAIGEEKLNELNYEDAPRFDMSQRGDEGFQLGGMLGDMIGMQAGGPLSYGGVTTSIPTFPQLYEEMDLAPKAGTERTDFEEKFQYDPEREGIVFEDYSRSIADATRTSQDKLYSQLMGQQAGAAKSGFAGGGGGAAQSRGRDTLMGDFMSQQSAAQSTLFKGVQNERDNWMREAGSGLGNLSSKEGTVDYQTFLQQTTPAGGNTSGTGLGMHGDAPGNPSIGDNYTNANGNQYEWNGVSWTRYT